MNEKKWQCINLQAEKDEFLGKNELICEYNKIWNLWTKMLLLDLYGEGRSRKWR